MSRLGWSGAHDLALITAARLATIGGQLLYLHLYSSRLTAHELGVYFFLTTASYFFNAIVFIPIDYFQQAKVRLLLETDGSLRSLVRLNALAIGSVAGIGVLMGLAFFFVAPSAVVSFIGTLCASIFLHIAQSLRGVLNNLGYRRVNALTQVVEIAIKYLLSWAMISFVATTAVALIAALATTLGIVSCVLLRAVVRLHLLDARGRSTSRFSARAIWSFAYPVSIAAVANWLQLQGYRFVLVPLGYAAPVGVYATTSNIGAAIMNAAASIYGQMYTPEIYRTSGRYTPRFLGIGAIVSLVVLTVVWIGAGELVTLATKGAMNAFASLAVFGVLVEAGNFLMGALSVDLTIRHRSRILLWSSLIGVIVAVAGFAVLHSLDRLAPATFGWPIVASQAFCLLYLVRMRRQFDRTPAGA